MKLIKTITYSALMGAASVVCTPLATADSVNSVTGVWTSATPAAAIAGIGTNTISWGTPAVTGGSKSSYVFAGIAPPLFSVFPDTTFDIGTFTHNNNPIFAPSLEAATLAVVTNLTIAGSTFDVTSVFDFAHFETTNNANPCADGGTNGVGVNVNGCADRVTFTTNVGETESFFIGGTEYVVNISAFLIAGSPASQFWTKENFSNEATLRGGIVEKASIVPIPAAAWLFGSALVGLAGIGHRRRTA